MPPVQAVLFDYGMVLSGPPDPAAWERIRIISGLDEPTLQREYWAHRHAYDRGDLTGHDFWTRAASASAITLTPAQIDALLDADTDLWSQLNLPMIHWAQSLQRAGIRTGILSNMGDAMYHGLHARYPWIQDFQHHTWSYALNLAKPEPAIYQHAIQGLQTPAPDILFIDDKPENIAAALSANMQAIQYLDHATFEHEMHQRGLGQLLTPPVPSWVHD
jgi:putative hydrolase of the HAD superfamily